MKRIIELGEQLLNNDNRDEVFDIIDKLYKIKKELEQPSFKKVSLIYAFRKDIDDRLENIKISISYFKKYCPNVEIIVVENDTTRYITEKLSFFNLIDKYNFIQDSSITNATYCKCIGINKAVSLSERDYIVQLDVDSIVDVDNILSGIKLLKDNNDNGVCIPYCGTVILTKNNCKQHFANKLCYETLWNLVRNNYRFGYSDNSVSIAHSQSVGGIGIYPRELFLNVGGFNPNFKGWGYEDVEIFERLKILGYTIHRLQDEKACLWHLDHVGTLKEMQSNYRYNEKLYKDIIAKNKEQMLDYIKRMNK